MPEPAGPAELRAIHRSGRTSHLRKFGPGRRRKRRLDFAGDIRSSFLLSKPTSRAAVSDLQAGYRGAAARLFVLHALRFLALLVLPVWGEAAGFVLMTISTRSPRAGWRTSPPSWLAAASSAVRARPASVLTLGMLRMPC
jgi:hypothetical protein